MGELTVPGAATLGVGLVAGGAGIALRHAGTTNPSPEEIARLKLAMDTAQGHYDRALAPGDPLPDNAAVVRRAKELLGTDVTAHATNGAARSVALTALTDETVMDDPVRALQRGWAKGQGKAVVLLQPGRGQFLTAQTGEKLVQLRDGHWRRHTISWTRTEPHRRPDGKGTEYRTVHYSDTVRVWDDTVEPFKRFEPRHKAVVGMMHPRHYELRNLGTPEQRALRARLESAAQSYTDAVDDAARAPGQLRASRVLIPVGATVALAGAGMLLHGLLSE